MKITFRFYVVFFVVYCFNGTIGNLSFAQNKKIDSLLTLIQTDKPDTNKVNHLNALYINFSLAGYYDSAMKYVELELKLSQQLNFEKGICVSYGNIGFVYGVFGNSEKTLDYYLKALKMAEQIQNKNEIAKHLTNLGLFYTNREEFLTGLKYLSDALKINEEIQYKKGIGICLNNIGLIYIKEKKYDEALSCYQKALSIATELKIDFGIIFCLEGLGNAYRAKGDYKKAHEYYSKALTIAQNSGYKNHIVGVLYFIGLLQIETKDYLNAETNLLEAMRLNSEVGDLGRKKIIEEAISELYTKTKRYQLALEHLRNVMVIKDSLFNSEKEKDITKHEMNYEFQKKQDQAKTEQNIKDAIANSEKKKQQFIIILVLAVLVLVLALAIFIFSSLRKTSKQKDIIELKNNETEQQKKTIEEKNKDITDSINYAKQIQRALLREEAHISKHLPEHFILFLPKDIVSGDFYWGFEKRDYWYVAVADCTGHGVPGAIMSMLGISFLNDIVASDKIYSPAEILNQLRARIISELRQTGEDGSSRDGMDISLICLNLKTLELQWAGANNALNYIQGGELKEIKADKQPIGYHPQQKSFTNHEIQLQNGDSIYIYSDGYADQFGGPKGKKLTYKRLDNFIVENHQLSMENQKVCFNQYFSYWKGGLEQIDDVCVIGIKI